MFSNQPGRRPVRRFSRTHRQLLAAGLAGIAALMTISLLRPSPPATTAILVANRELPAGHTISDSDVGEAQWPTSVGPPPSVAEIDDIRGRVTTGPLAAGEPIGVARVIGPGLLELAGATSSDGTELVAAPIRLADSGQAALIRPGDTVDVIAARASDGGGQSAERVATDVRVITIAGAADDDPGLLSSSDDSGAASTESGSLIVLAVTPVTATDLAAASTRSKLSVVLKAASARVETSQTGALTP